MSLIFKSYEERVENRNGEISKMTKTTTHNGKKGVEVITKNGKTSKKKFKVSKKKLPNIKQSIILPSILVSVPMHKVITEDNKTKNIKLKKSLRNIVKSKRFKKYTRSKKKSRLQKKLSKRKSKKTRKRSKKRSFWNKLIGR
tara:strand:- start:1139 stop:1564 length:426 start_codon:yes stop_codon:yes gene_type:complete